MKSPRVDELPPWNSRPVLWDNGAENEVVAALRQQPATRPTPQEGADVKIEPRTPVDVHSDGAP